MTIRIAPFLLVVVACGTRPNAGAERDAFSRDLDVDVGQSEDTPASRDVAGDTPVSDVPSSDTPSGDVSVIDVARPDVAQDVSMPDVSGPDVSMDSAPDVSLDVFDAPLSSDVEDDPVDDARPDVEPDVELECDDDGDGYLAEACGGDDCDDTVYTVNRGRTEVCNFRDDNCDRGINEGLDCRVYAHTSTGLYLVDPFAGTDDFVTSVPSLFDFDTAPDGSLFGISGTRVLYVFDEAGDDWDRVGAFATTAGNGFAIDSFGVGYITAGNNLFTIDTATAVTTLVGAMGGGFLSSGDCVVDKSDQLFMTSVSPGQDQLVAVSRATGEGRLIGDTGFSGIWGLTAAWGHLFGFTRTGQIVELEPSTGAGRLRHTIVDRSWYGAASSPDR